MNLFFWRKPSKITVSALDQSWILEGFQECVDGFWIWQNNQFYISSRLKERLGYDQLSDTKFSDANWWREFIHHDDIDKLKKFLKDIINHESKTPQIEIRIRHYHGHWVWFFVHCYIDAQYTNGPRVLGTFSDISSYRLLHDQLERTIEELENVSQEKSHFISHLNHEIRTPINGILGGVEQLKTTQLSVKQQDYINNITSCADLLLNLVNEVLDLSKIAAGKLEIDPVEFELDKVIQQSISMLAPSAARKNLSLNLNMDKNLPHYLRGDSLRLQQVIINLLNNAIKFTDTGKVTLEIKLHHQQGIGKPNHLLFRVIDTGHGIAKDVLPRLFQDFTQANKSVTRTFGGTGLGLSICRKLIALMGGEIGAQSVIGKGSTFWFIIPLISVEKSSLDKHKDTSTSFKKDETLDRFNILITEDNPINQQVLKELLTSLNQNFIIANNGAEAIKLFQQNEFDLVFMDMNMPILDGFSATKRIRQLETGKEIPIIILTADTYSLDKKELLKNGVTQIIHKPVTKDKLSEILKFYQSEKFIPETRNLNPDTCTLTNNLHPETSTNINFLQIMTLSHDIGADTVIKLLDAYTEEGLHIINQLENHKESDFHNLAHTIAGMSENLGMTGVASLSRQLMLALQEKEKDPYPLIHALSEVFHHTVAEIDHLKHQIHT